MQDIVSMLKGLSAQELNSALEKARAFAATDEGRKMMNSLKNGRPIEGLPISTDEQNKIIAELSKNPKTAKQLAAILGKK